MPSLRRHTFVALVLSGALTVLITPNSHAKSPLPDGAFTFGPSAAWVLGTEQERPLLLGAELSGLTNVFWVTLGGRVLTAESGTTGLMHFEAGAWFLAAFGVGYSQRLWGGAFDEINLHTFIGFPAPLAEVSTHRMFYIVFPYYRPMLGLASGNVVHEIGLMVKFSTFSAIR